MSKVRSVVTLATVMSVAVAAACSSPSPSATSADRTASTSEALASRGGRDLAAMRVERGLSISPFAIDTSHMSHKERARVGLGSYIANGTSDCGGCHSSPAGFLAGGNPFKLDDQGHVAFSRNLTSDPATGLRMTLAQFKTVIRTGADLHQDPTKQLTVMPWPIFRWMSDDDLEALYAYLVLVPAAVNSVPLDDKTGLSLPPSTPFPGYYDDGDVARPLPRSDASFDAARGLAIAPLQNPRGLRGDLLQDYALGSYIANSMTHCEDCHTDPDRAASFKINTAAYLLGGAVYDVPPPVQPVVKQVRSTTANLKGKNHGFFNEPDDSFARFKAIITTGTHADENPPRPLGWPMTIIAANLATLIDEDLESVYTYVKNAPSITSELDQERQSYARYCTSSTDCHAGESCALATGECVGQACATDTDCDTCQTCSAGACAAPLASSACLARSR